MATERIGAPPATIEPCPSDTILTRLIVTARVGCANFNVNTSGELLHPARINAGESDAGSHHRHAIKLAVVLVHEGI